MKFQIKRILMPHRELIIAVSSGGMLSLGWDLRSHVQAMVIGRLAHVCLSLMGINKNMHKNRRLILLLRNLMRDEPFTYHTTRVLAAVS